MKGRFERNRKPDAKRTLIGIDVITAQKPVLEYLYESYKKGTKSQKRVFVWRMWVSYDQAIEFGTYLDLYPDGSVSCFTVDPGRIRSHPVAPVQRGRKNART